MKIYICDGTAENFFTAVFDAFKDKECSITSEDNVQLSLGADAVRVVTDAEKSRRVQNGIRKYDKQGVNDVLLALRCGDGDMLKIALEYIKLLMKCKSPVKKMYNMREVVSFNDIIYKVTGEAHKLKGFLRFIESSSGAFYAPYSPDNDVTELIMPHFAERFKSERFVIHDINRKIAGIYDGRVWFTGYADETQIYISENEKAFETLWKKYYKAVNIKERPHEKQMKGYMPVRYWKHLPEKQDGG